MDKVKISKSQADALDEMFKQGINVRVNIINAHYRDSNGWMDHCTPLNGMDTDELIQAVYIGYEVEETPEEQIRAHFLKHWENQKTFSVDRETSRVICTTISNVLNALNIKIVGVNHE